MNFPGDGPAKNMVAVTSWRKRICGRGADAPESPTREPSEPSESPTPSPLRTMRRSKRFSRGSDSEVEVKKGSPLVVAAEAQSPVTPSETRAMRRRRSAVENLVTQKGQEEDPTPVKRQAPALAAEGEPAEKKAKMMELPVPTSLAPKVEEEAAAVPTPKVEESAPPKVEESAPSASPPSTSAASSTKTKEQPTDQDLALGLAAALQQLTSLYVDDGRLTRFHACSRPCISLEHYAGRIRRTFDCSGASFVLALVYLDRVLQRSPEVIVTPLTVHRLFLTSVTVAVKFNDDIFYSNRHYAGSGGVHLDEMNVMETEFLKLLDWKLQVYPEEYEAFSDLSVAFARGETAAFSDYSDSSEKKGPSGLEGTTFLSACAKSLRRNG